MVFNSPDYGGGGTNVHMCKTHRTGEHPFHFNFIIYQFKKKRLVNNWTF